MSPLRSAKLQHGAPRARRQYALPRRDVAGEAFPHWGARASAHTFPAPPRRDPGRDVSKSMRVWRTPSAAMIRANSGFLCATPVLPETEVPATGVGKAGTSAGTEVKRGAPPDCHLSETCDTNQTDSRHVRTMTHRSDGRSAVFGDGVSAPEVESVTRDGRSCHHLSHGAGYVDPATTMRAGSDARWRGRSRRVGCWLPTIEPARRARESPHRATQTAVARS